MVVTIKAGTSPVSIRSVRAAYVPLGAFPPETYRVVLPPKYGPLFRGRDIQAYVDTNTRIVHSGVRHHARHALRSRSGPVA